MSVDFSGLFLSCFVCVSRVCLNNCTTKNLPVFSDPKIGSSRRARVSFRSRESSYLTSIITKHSSPRFAFLCNRGKCFFSSFLPTRYRAWPCSIEDVPGTQRERICLIVHHFPLCSPLTPIHSHILPGKSVSSFYFLDNHRYHHHCIIIIIMVIL